MRTIERTLKIAKPSELIRSSLKKEDVKQQILNDIRKIANVLPANYKDLLIYICTVLESTFVKKDGVDKMGLLIDILSDLYGEIITPQLRQEIKEAVEHLLSRGLIKKVSILRYALSYSFEILKKLVPLLL